RRDVAATAGADEVSRAERVRAQEGATAVDALGHARFRGIVARRRPTGIARDAPVRGRDGARILVGAVPVLAPLPDVARDVVQAVTVGREAGDGRDASPAVVRRIVVGEAPLEGVGHPLPTGAQLVAPGVSLARKAAAGGELELGFGG